MSIIKTRIPNIHCPSGTDKLNPKNSDYLRKDLRKNELEVPPEKPIDKIVYAKEHKKRNTVVETEDGEIPLLINTFGSNVSKEKLPGEDRLYFKKQALSALNKLIDGLEDRPLGR